jgi:DNA-directed RNA polymerase subunit M/transcription elongation factor TFIIS
MQEFVRVCPICASKNDRNLFTGKFQVPGWFDYYISEEAADTTCPFHKEQKLIKKSMTCKEFDILSVISNEPSFMDIMESLKEENPVEYQLKLAQFKTQAAQIKAEVKKVKCPKCGSTSITTGARGVNMFWGVIGASKTVNRCANCGYTWKPNRR